MSSPKKPPRDMMNDPQNTARQTRPMHQGQASLREEEMLLFDYGVHGSELMAGGAASGLGGRDLDRLGPQHQATQFSSRTTSQHGDFQCIPNIFSATSQTAFPGAITAYPGLQPGTTSASAVAVNWQPANSSLYGNDGSPAVSGGSSASVFGYASQQDTPNPYVGDYVSPTALQNAPQPGFNVFPWPGASDGSVSLGTPNPGILTSPIMPNYDMLSGTPEGAFSDSDPAMYAKVEDWQRRHSTQGVKMEMEMQMVTEPPRHKRAKKSIDEQSAVSSVPALSQTTPSPATNAANPSSSSSTTATTTTGKTKLRSASRASKNTQHRPEETPQERKSRNSHNLVEKQYRNRLNMQFEILMNTLPESMRSPTSVGGAGASTSGGDSDGGGNGGGGGGGGGSAAHHGAFEVGERRLSKAQVLDMSARYIRSLERERDKLEEEKQELLENVRRLKGESNRGEGDAGGEEEGEGG